MLIKVFGTWVNPNNITHIETIDMSGKCVICFNGGEHSKAFSASADQVAAEINKQISQPPKIGK